MTELGRNFECEDLGDGRFCLTQYLKPIAYKKTGVFRRITNALGSSGDPNFPTGVDELCQFRLDTRIAGKSPLFYFGKGQSRVTLALLNANNVAGVVDGNSVIFSEAWDNADLKLTMANHRLQKDIVFRTGHPRQIGVRINSHVGFDPETLIFGNDFCILQPVLHDPNSIDDIPLVWDVTRQGGKYILTVTLPDGDFAGWVLDPTLTLQPDPTDGYDALLSSHLPNTNYETRDNFFAGETNAVIDAIGRGLIKFNLASLPDDAVISLATLSLYPYLDRSDNARTFRVYRQKRAWVESQATWNIYSTGNNWQTPGGFGVDDCEQVDIGSRAFTATEAMDEFKDFVLSPTTKAALDLTNGWLIKSDTELNDAYYFYVSDYATVAKRPKLVTVYTVGGGPALASSIFHSAIHGGTLVR